ncbi:ribonuclease P protein component [Xanthomonas translucens]|uniref:ribonuclease P protein component n=1 Tax=Xanthomonas campestris pv. translucens TaxID=343 RepID=UPI0009B7D902|nr:ribonuclease P protein component [Xanthomonas translucens]MBC3970650.1 ribonuclease P protein component [Xanthomonas translucens pv. undulosa]MCT8280676.1 ribonuclease P protein component [Xanthomonas translucens pv. undulosa]MCT8315488.1 ribonuclease P protein component [Xanthomonas translucens pv. undulosa]QSQ56214.1 ribonuclease P protein component [Xanthomonas translucens pv. undulosa]UKE39799.1 ribonuclease P protein component [Xanthomonas translucens pv. undulosa]
MNHPDPRRRFPPSARVRTSAEYRVVFDAARRCSEPLMSLHWCSADHPARLGLAVSRKVDKRAVVRNRIKRVLRDATRHLLPWLAPGDYVVVARSAAAQASGEQLRQAYLRLLRRAGALPAPAADGTMPPPLPPSSPTSKSEPVSG